MSTPHEIPATMFALAMGTSPAVPTTASAIAVRMRSGEFADITAQIRAATTEEEAKVLKETLPAFILAVATKRGNAGLTQAPEYLQADIDVYDPHDSHLLREQFKSDPHVAMVTESPRGGPKAFLRIDPTKPFSVSWAAAAKYMMDTYGVVMDPNAKGASRLCYMGHSPDCSVATGPVQVIPYPAVSTPPPPPVSSSAGASSTKAEVIELLKYIKPMQEHDHDHRTMIVGAVSSELSHDDTVEVCAEWAGVEPSKIENDLVHRKNQYTIGTLKYLARLGGWLPTVPKSGDGLLILPSNPGIPIIESAEAIFAAIKPTLTMFIRGRCVHEVLLTNAEARLEPVKAVAFRSRLELYGRLMVWRLDRYGDLILVTTVCPDDTAKALLATKEAELLPPIRSLVASPVLALTDDGNELVVLERGWNPQAGGVFVTGGSSPISVPLPEALAALSDLMTDFDFATPGDRSRYLASLLTPAMKAGGLLTARTPVEAAEATASQSGKGFQCNLRAAIYKETINLIAQRKGGVGSFDEALSNALITARPFILFDNLRGDKLDSPFLEATLTADGPIQCRVPYRGIVEVDTRPFTFALTSNGITTTKDLANRCSITRIKKRPPGYLFRTYPEGDLLAHVKARQQYYLSCVFAVVGKWFEVGCPRTNESRHDFRDWCRALDWIVQNLFQEAPLMDGHEAAQDRVCDEGRSWLRAVALAVEEDSQLDCELTASELADLSAEHSIQIPSRKPDAAESDCAPAIGRIMKKIFTDGNEVQIEGFTVARRPYTTNDGKPGKRYHFSKTP